MLMVRNPELTILYVNPLKLLPASLKPNDINSIDTNNGSEINRQQ